MKIVKGSELVDVFKFLAKIPLLDPRKENCKKRFLNKKIKKHDFLSQKS